MPGLSPPIGMPIPGSTNQKDVRWWLRLLSRYLSRGGKWDLYLRRRADAWLDYMNEEFGGHC